MVGHVTETWTRLCRLVELTPGEPHGVVVGDSGQDRDRVCVILRRGTPVSMVDRCPHRDISLSGGTVHDDDLVCPGHFWRFDLSTGTRRDEPTTHLTIHPTRVVDGWVEAQLPKLEPAMSVRERLLKSAGLRSG